jgi:hypothetical protein
LHNHRNRRTCLNRLLGICTVICRTPARPGAAAVDCTLAACPPIVQAMETVWPTPVANTVIVLPAYAGVAALLVDPF